MGDTHPDWPVFRVGINTGAAIVGVVGTDARRSFAAVGDPVNTGARLMTVARAGEIVVGATTWAILADPTAGEPLGPVQVKGKREPVEAWRLHVPGGAFADIGLGLSLSTNGRQPMSVWFGLHLPSYTHPDTPPERLFDRVVEQAKAAETAGFDVVTVMDHLYQIDGIGGPDEPMLEGWSVLAALARETTRVRLGTLVTGVTYRNPALLAKQVTTLDTISGGRAILGLGAAWNEVEHEGYGYDFPPIRERMDRLDEALAIIKAMFTEDRPTFAGRYYRIDQAFNVPRPVQPGGPKILVGGGGEQRTLRIAAKYADMTHWFSLGLDAAQAQDRGPRALLRGDRSRSVDHRADGRRARDRHRDGGRREGIPRAHPARTSALRQGRDARPGGRGDCVRTSRRASRASRSTTTCTRRPSRSRASARSSSWSRARRRSGHARGRTERPAPSRGGV